MLPAFARGRQADHSLRACNFGRHAAYLVRFGTWTFTTCTPGTPATSTAAALGSIDSTLPADHEKAAFERTRRFNRRRSWLLGFAIACSLLPFSFAFTDEIDWMMLRDHPQQAIMFWIAGAGCWLAYYLLGQRLQAPADLR